MPVSVTNHIPRPGTFDRSAIASKYLKVMVQGRPMEMSIDRMTDAQIRAAMRIPVNRTRVAQGWRVTREGRVLRAPTATTTLPSPTVPQPTTHVDPRPTTTPPPGGFVNDHGAITGVKPVQGIDAHTPAPITDNLPVGPTGNPQNARPGASVFNTSGGNRNMAHQVGGTGHNFGVRPGRMLNAARDMYGWNQHNGGQPNSLGSHGSYHGAPAKAPGKGNLQQMHQSSLGNVMNIGQGASSYHRPASGPVHQWTVHPNPGGGYGSQWQDSQPGNTKPSRPPIVKPANPVTPGGTENDHGPLRPPPPTRPTPPQNGHAPLVSKDPPQPDPATGGQANSNQQHSQMIKNWKVGQEYQGRLIMGGVWIVRPGGRKVYVPIVNNPGAGSRTMIHPAWSGMRN